MNELTKKVSLLGTGLVAGAVAFTVVGVSAHPGEDGAHLGRGEVISEVLGISREELKEAKQDGQSLEEIVTNNGFESVEAFEAEMETAVRAKLAEQGLSDEEIDEKVANMQERRGIKEDIREARQEIFGLTREEVKAKIEAGMTKEEVLAEAGFDSKDALRDAIAASLAETWAAEGVSEEEIEERLERFEERGEKRGRHGHRGHHGFGELNDTDA